jgi:hypothetical protein
MVKSLGRKIQHRYAPSSYHTTPVRLLYRSFSRVCDSLPYMGQERSHVRRLRERHCYNQRRLAKVASTCAKAAAEGYDWVWIDSCCIQKTSSSELQEAINSMWAWYQQSTVCYVYLTDVPTKSESHGQDFETSRWWKRGWTLQELLAPTSVEFYARDWSAIGTRSSRVEQISRITTIDEMVLRDGNYHSRIAAERMSWAAHRETTRPEDMAYCLLGLFNIST